MAHDKMKGMGKEVEGSVEEGVGKMTGQRDMEAKGAVKKAAGRGQRRVGEAKGHARKAIDNASDTAKGALD